jgi:hypothetical protein
LKQARNLRQFPRAALLLQHASAQTRIPEKLAIAALPPLPPGGDPICARYTSRESGTGDEDNDADATTRRCRKCCC